MALQGLDQPDHNLAIQGFHQWIEEAQVKGTGDASLDLKHPFVPSSKVQAYFQDINNIEKILAALYGPFESPVDAQEIKRKYAKVFCILLLIGRGRYIDSFVKYDNLSDNHLPFEGRPQSFPPSSSTAPYFFERFCDQQWALCTPVFRENMDKEFKAKEILPIIDEQKLVGGGSATTYKIKLHDEYDLLSESKTEAASWSSFQSSYYTQDPNHELANTFVLKRYRTQDAEKYFKNEVSAFRKLRNAGRHPNIIGYHGCFIHNGTYNVILEFADRGTLEQYFVKTPPPTSGEDIIAFWQGILGIVGALTNIHGIPYSNHDGPQIFQGWHQDVKPSNVLIKSCPGKSPYYSQFKLADLGLSHFKKKMSSQEEATDGDTYGTRAYGAPECYRPEVDTEGCSLAVKQNVDIWSMGCVLSEAAIWVVRGWNGLDEYRRQRRLETKEVPNFEEGECFHNGVETLAVVREMHRNLHEEIRRADHITQAACSMVEDMLVESEGRPNANHLYRKSRRLIEEAKKELKRSSTRASMQSATPSRQLPPEIPYDNVSRTPHPSGRFTHVRTASPDSIDPSPTGGRQAMQNGWSQFRRASQRPNNHDRRSGHQDVNAITSEILNNNPTMERNDPFVETNPGQDSSGQNHLLSAFQQITPEQDQSRTQTRGHTLPNMLNRANGASIMRTPYMNSRTDARTAESGLLAPMTTTSARVSSRDRPIKQQGTGYQDYDTLDSRPEIVAPVESGNVPTADDGAEASPKTPPPHLSMATVRKWKSHMKSYGKASKSALPDQYLLKDLEKRDHVFLIDDSRSMGRHWKEVRDVFAHLAYIVKDADPDGIELLFTISSDARRSHHTTPLLDLLDSTRPQGASNIRSQLSEVLKEYQARLKGQKPSRWSRHRHSPGRVRRQTLYVFTDGVWQPDCDVTEMIKHLVDCLKEHNLYREQFGIQFIRFGDDPEGIQRLEHLDAGLKLSMDIVDTEPWNGNVWKMLLGAINKWFDDDPKDDRKNDLATNGNRHTLGHPSSSESTTTGGMHQLLERAHHQARVEQD